jgi:DNA ligase-1
VRRFAELYIELDETTRTSEKIEALGRYFRGAPPLDAAWAIFFLTGRKLGKSVSSRILRELVAEESGYPQWLVEQSHRVVGDLSETIALLLPDPATEPSPPLHVIVEERLRMLGNLTQKSQKQVILQTLRQLNTNERLVFLKLLSGNFRIGVSKQLLIRALAETTGLSVAIIAHRLAGHWMPGEETMARLLAAHDPAAAADPGVPYPFMLANPLHESAETLGPIDDWLIEWKWDGIRAQLIRRGGGAMLWSRGEEIVSHTFPEIIHAAAGLGDGTVLDGEIVAWNEAGNRPEPFTRLQRRLNRQTVEMTFWPEVPITFIAFDLLEEDGKDMRDWPLSKRREVMEKTVGALVGGVIRPATPLTDQTWAGITEHIATSRERGVEGVMLKRRDSVYLPGRPAGLWWKLKVEPFTVDAVMIAAEPGHGRRAGLLTDYTFGVWDAGALVPIAKAYSGLTDEEIVEMDRFVRAHTTARHGPVHVVEPLRVFEIGFEAIQLSTRHKSGIAVRFPRILRMRTDKKPAEADQLETMRELLKQVEAMR